MGSPPLTVASRASSTSALDSIHISPLAEAHRLYSQASRAFFPERDMVLAPLHTRLLAIASSFKQEQLERIQRVVDSHASKETAASAPGEACPTSALQKNTMSKLRKPPNKALNRCAAPLAPCNPGETCLFRRPSPPLACLRDLQLSA